MKTITEVCKIVGTTRRTLQGYNDIGLLKPTATNDLGYWLYDEIAVDKLFIIQAFVEVGYKRQEIKNIFELNNSDLSDVLNQLLKELELKKNKVIGMINLINLVNHSIENSKNLLSIFKDIEISIFYKDENFSSKLNSTIETIANFSEEELETEKVISTTIFALMGIANNLPDKISFESEITQSKIKDAIVLFIDSLTNNKILKENETPTTTLDKALLFNEFVNEILLSDEEFCREFDLKCGEGSSNNIKSAIKYYIKKLNTWKESFVNYG